MLDKIFPEKKLQEVFGYLLLAVLVIYSVKGILVLRNEYNMVSRTITVTADGKATGQFNIAQVSLGIVSTSLNVNDAHDKNSKVIIALTDFIVKSGVAKEDIQTTNYSIYPTYSYNGTQKITGYEVRQSLTVKIRDLTKVDSILSLAVKNGANQIDSLNFITEDENKLKNEAVSKAIASARDRAQTIATSLGVTLGKVSSYNDYYNVGNQGQYCMGCGGGGGGMGADSGSVSAVSPGQNEVIANVTVYFEVK